MSCFVKSGVEQMHICERLKYERCRLRRTQVGMATLAGIRQEHWSRMEAGRFSVSLKALVAIAECGGDVHYILTGDRRFIDEGSLLSHERGLIRLFHAVADAGGLDSLGACEKIYISTGQIAGETK